MRVRFGVFCQLLVEVEALGVDLDAELARFGATRADFEGQVHTLSPPDRDALRERLLHVAGDPLLFLRAADRVPFGAFDIIDHLGAQVETVGGVFAMLARYFRIVNGAIQPRLHATADGWCFDAPGTLGPGCEVLFTVTLNRLRRFLGERVRPRRVDLSRPRPTDARVFSTIFGTAVYFNQARDAIILDDAQFRRPLSASDAGLRAILEAHARVLHAEVETADAMVDAVEHEIVAVLSAGTATLTAIATRLGMSTRTLQRRLAAEGTDFKAELTRVRRARAQSYLTANQLGVTEIAFLLGYSDATAFQRAFKRWTGASVGQWRRVNATR